MGADTDVLLDASPMLRNNVLLQNSAWYQSSNQPTCAITLPWSCIVREGPSGQRWQKTEASTL